MLLACCFHQRKYLVQGFVKWALNETCTHSSLQFEWFSIGYRFFYLECVYLSLLYTLLVFDIWYDFLRRPTHFKIYIEREIERYCCYLRTPGFHMLNWLFCCFALGPLARASVPLLAVLQHSFPLVSGKGGKLIRSKWVFHKAELALRLNYDWNNVTNLSPGI